MENFKFKKDKDAFIIFRGTLRYLLGQYLKKEPRHIEIHYGPWGKPFLSQQHSLFFNLTHSKNYALYAFTSSCEVGIDLEYIDSTLDIEELALTIFSPQEQAYWTKVNPEDKISIFFKLWVYKEAFLKASGQGWLSDQHELPLSVLKNLYKFPSVDLRSEEIASPYYFEVIPGYASAIYLEKPYMRPLHYTLNLMSKYI